MPKKKHAKLKRHHVYLAVIIAAIAGVLYNSWPLGYFLNPEVGARGLASELGAVGQPYNWVFILGDIICGILIVIVTWLVWRNLKKQQHHALWLKLVLASYALFGVFTAFDAILPMRCVPSLQVCPGLDQDHALLVHAVANMTSALCLFAAALTMWHVNKFHDRYHFMSVMVLAWVLLGLMTLFYFFVPGPGYIAQHYFIAICAGWIALLPAIISRSLKLEKVKVRQLFR